MAERSRIPDSIRGGEIRWYAAGADYGRLLLEDLKIRKFIMESLPQAGISKVVIERSAELCRIFIYLARAAAITGEKGAGIEALRDQISAMTSSDVSLNIVEIRKPEIDSKLVAQGVADQLERGIAFRAAMKRAVQSALRHGAEGIRITCSGRLGGAEARTEQYREGRVPPHTLRANVDYAEATAHTAYGVCGVKVWIFKGEILGRDPLAEGRRMKEAVTSGAGSTPDASGPDDNFKEAPSSIGSAAYAPDARARAILRGIEIARSDLGAAGGAYDLEQVRELLGGISRQAVAKRVNEGALLAVPGPSNKRRFPTFQFQADGTPVRRLKEVLAALPTRNDWAILNFLVRPDPRLEGRTPIAMLREGLVEPVIAAARSWGEQGG